VQGARPAPAGGETTGQEGPQFLSMLAAASGGRRQEAAGAAAEVEPEAHAEAEDPAMAALLAAMLPGLSPATAQASGTAGDAESQATDEGEAPGSLEGLTGEAADFTGQAASQALEEALQAGLAQSMNEDGDVQEGTPGLPPQFGKELAAAIREAAADQRTPDLRAPAISEASPTTTYAAGAAPATVTAAAAGGAEPALRSPMGSPRWAEELGSRLVMMSTRGQQEGSLTLSPEHLGPLEVRITMQQNTASVWFGAQHADTRAALTEAMPRLRELFAEAGLSLGHSGVSQDAPRRELQEAPQRRSGGDAVIAAAQTSPQPVRHALAGLLDLYA
jgi:flagellar hook-length control protein FliK